MNTLPLVDRDERTIAVENASYRWAYMFLSFGLLVAVVYRSGIYGESPWDLLALVVLSGGAGTAYQAYYRVLTKRWLAAAFVATLAAAFVAGFLVFLRR